jgi:hypothetical protein
MVYSPILNTMLAIVIIANSVLLTLNKYPQYDESFISILNKLNFVFTFMFTMEIVVKIVGLSPKTFFKDKYHIFDLGVVLVSIIEISLSS